MYYSDEIIEEVRSRNDIVDVISSYVNLKKKGNSYSACCPFHHEKTPSCEPGETDVSLLRLWCWRQCVYFFDGA